MADEDVDATEEEIPTEDLEVEVDEEFDFGFPVTSAERKILTQQNFALQTESKIWDANQMDLSMINFNPYMVLIQIRVLFELLRQKTGMSEFETETAFKAEMIKNMRNDRKNILKLRKDMERQARAAGILVPDKQMLGPDGTPINPRMN